MAIAKFRELLGHLPLDFTYEGVVHPRARMDGRRKGFSDRLVATFKERIRTAARVAYPHGVHTVEAAHLMVHVFPLSQVGLLHVEKTVSDALVKEKWIKNDRFGDVTEITVHRHRSTLGMESVKATVRNQNGQDELVLPQLLTPIHEWMPITPEVDYSLANKAFPTRQAYESTLRGCLGDEWDLGLDAVDRGLLRSLVKAGPDSILSRGFELSIHFTINRKSPWDLDNAALFVLDALALRLLDLGVTEEPVSLDRLVEWVHVRGQNDAESGFRVNLRHPRLDEWRLAARSPV